MPKLPATLLGAALLLMIPGFGHASRWYQVEVIIFTQQDRYGTEAAPQDIDLQYPLRVTHFGEGDFSQLPKEQRQLNADAYTLARTGVYKVLFHEAWRQAGKSQEHTSWLLIKGGEQLGDHYQLEGSLKLYLNSYLHLVTNLWLLTPADAYSTPSTSTTTSTTTTTSVYASTRDLPPLPGEPSSGAQSLGTSTSSYPAVPLKEIYTFEQSDRLELGKIHYLDHPKMGILVKVTRAQRSDANTPVIANPTATSVLE